MDIKLIKHSVGSKEVLLSASGEVTAEGKLHNTADKDPKKILKCSGRAAITSKSVSDRGVTIEGTATVSVIFLDSEGELSFGENTLLFSKNFESDTSLSGGEVFAEITDSSFKASLSPDRGIAVFAGLQLSAKVLKNSEREVICDVECRDVEKLCATAEITLPVCRAEKNLIVEEDVSIGNGQPSVRCLVRHSAVATVDDAKLMGGKVMVKGTVRVYVLYLPEEGTRPQSFEESFPFSQLVDAEGAGEDCLCKGSVRILYCELIPHAVDDEIRSFSFAAKLAIAAEVYCETELPVVLDAYSTKGGCRIERGKHSFKKLRENVNQRFVARKDAEFTDGAVGSVIDMWCEVKNHTCRFDDGKLQVSGTLLAALLVFDADGNPDCLERPIDFEYSYLPERDFSSPEADCCLSVSHCSYTITGENTLTLSAEMMLSASIYENVSYDILENILQDDSVSEKTATGGIVLYFADAGESIWDIARRYNSSLSEIKELNGVTEDILSEPKKFLIPSK